MTAEAPVPAPVDSPPLPAHEAHPLSDAALRAEQGQRQVGQIGLRLERRLGDGAAQELPRLLLERAAMRGRALLEPGVQGRIDVADQQAGHTSAPATASTG